MVCKEADPTNHGKWIDKKSIPGHLQSVLHGANVQDKQQREREAAESSQRLQQAYSAAPVDLIPHNTEPDALPTGMYEHPRSPSPAWAEYTVAGLHAPSVPSFITTAAHDRGLEHERLKQQVTRMLVQSEESDDEDNNLGHTVDAFKDLGLSIP
jgi:hypothetical protein